jgi:prepilin-type processing-associated H-X9-DG protein
MRRKTGFTRIDAVFVLACIILVLWQAAVINAAGRERSKRELCLANLRMLTAAWQTYAADNNGKIVNGGQTPFNSVTEPFWCTPLPPVPATDEVGTFPTTRFDWDLTLPYAERVSLLKRGALYGYVQNLDIYRCPEADKDMHRTYIIPVSMNAACMVCGYPGNGPVVKNSAQIARPAERIAFLEEKRLSPDAFQFPYSSNPYWWLDKPSITHLNGANFGFADGHAEYHRWQCEATIKWIECDSCQPPGVSQCPNDVQWMSNGVWGGAR